jgi:hypothetical protein
MGASSNFGNYGTRLLFEEEAKGNIFLVRGRWLRIAC